MPGVARTAYVSCFRRMWLSVRKASCEREAASGNESGHHAAGMSVGHRMATLLQRGYLGTPMPCSFWKHIYKPVNPAEPFCQRCGWTIPSGKPCSPVLPAEKELVEGLIHRVKHLLQSSSATQAVSGTPSDEAEPFSTSLREGKESRIGQYRLVCVGERRHGVGLRGRR